jgi:23S rRNA (cytidine2498-2'-O)-methyltransferase
MSFALVAHCRAGFEPEVARDLETLAAAARLRASPDIVPGRGFVVATLDAPLDLRRASTVLRGPEPVFARSVLAAHGPVAIADPTRSAARPDRITPLVTAIEVVAPAGPFAALWIEHPDTNEGKQLSPLAKSLHARLAAALTAKGVRTDDTSARRRLHVMLADGATAWIGISDVATGSPWPMGIPRLHLPRAAPSRSTLKLAEAFVTFLGDDEAHRVRAGQRAVDLGAAPGGWTWQLAQRGLRVVAVDNGALKGAVSDDPRVTHVRTDGLTFRPRKPVDWVTCDIVESPGRIAALMGAWIAEGHARQAIFNLKLPMKKRYDEVARCRGLIMDALAGHAVRATLRVRQLYHDREEVTGCLVRD